MKVYVVIYDIRNGGNGPSVFKTKKAALNSIREDFADEEDFTEDHLKQLVVDGYTNFGWDGENTISLHQEKVNE
jgi:hypothetical protein